MVRFLWQPLPEIEPMEFRCENRVVTSEKADPRWVESLQWRVNHAAVGPPEMDPDLGRILYLRRYAGFHVEILEVVEAPETPGALR